LLNTTGRGAEMFEDLVQFPPRASSAYMRKLIDRGEYLKAYDLGTRLLSEPGYDRLEAAKLHSLCLSKLGMHAEAIARLEDFNTHLINDDKEVYGLLGSFYKKRWLELRASDQKAADRSLRSALSGYMRSRELGGDYWCAINAATLARILGETDLSSRLAEEVVTECWTEYNRHGTACVFWVPASLGEAYLIQEEYGSSISWYQAARSHVSGNLGWIGSTRSNAALILDVLRPGELLAGQVMDAIPRLRVALFAGHKLDEPERKHPRFPSDLSDRVKQKLRKFLAQMRLDIGIASAADGSDILFHECLQGMGKRTHVVLPSPAAHFRTRIAQTAGDAWMARFDAVLEKAGSIETASASSFENDTADVYALCADFMLGTALDMAQTFDAELVPLVIWDGMTEARSGGTAYTVSRLRDLGYSPERIPILESAQISGNSHRATPVVDGFSYREMGIYEPRIRPIVVLTTGMSGGSEEKNASQLGKLADSVMESCRRSSVEVLHSGFLPGELYLVLDSLEGLIRLLTSCRTDLDRGDYQAMVVHAGLVIRTESSLTGIRDHYCREIEEAMALAMSLRLQTDVCTMQIKALISTHLTTDLGFSYKGRFETRDGHSLQVYAIHAPSTSG
jgi:tetratricopeptide (TPR) repeat protein